MAKQELLDYWKNLRIIKDEKLLKAFQEVPREYFVPPDLEREAYSDIPLPIGHDQTISQPTTVMLMIQALELKKTDKVLEIGAGSGYNAALMAKLCKEVIATEIIPELAAQAKKNLKKAGMQNVQVLTRDGSQGHAKEAPYDKIILTAGCRTFPLPLIQQLKEGGIILGPVGPSRYNQVMVKGRKMQGALKTEHLGYFAFVPLRGKYGE